MVSRYVAAPRLIDLDTGQVIGLLTRVVVGDRELVLGRGEQELEVSVDASWTAAA